MSGGKRRNFVMLGLGDALCSVFAWSKNTTRGAIGLGVAKLGVGVANLGVANLGVMALEKRGEAVYAANLAAKEKEELSSVASPGVEQGEKRRRL